MQLGNLSGPLLDGGHYELVSRFVRESAEPDTTADQLSDVTSEGSQKGATLFTGGFEGFAAIFASYRPQSAPERYDSEPT